MVSVLEGKELTQDIYTENVLKSILEAFELEGNVHIKPPCNGKKQDDCFFESPWSEYA